MTTSRSNQVGAAAPSHRDPMTSLERHPDLLDLFLRQPSGVQDAYLRWWAERPEHRASHRDTLDAFLAGYYARAGRRRAA